MKNQSYKSVLHHLGLACLMLAASLILFSAQIYAEGEEQIDFFKNSEFLTWEKNNQEFYIRTSIGMATLVIAQYDKPKARCVSDIFNEDEDGMYAFVLDSMKRFPDYPPKGTILAVIEKKCGKLNN